MNAPYITTKRALSRRTMLKGAGVSLALPMLDAMLPCFARAASEAALPPRRFVGMMTNMGILPQFFFPEKSGKDYTLSPYLEFLKEQRDQLTVFSGVSLPGVDGGHAAEKSFLTGAPGASRGSFKNSISLDQVMAEKIGGDTRFPSLSLMIGAEMMSCSWTRSGSMIPPERSPLKLFQQLFLENTAEQKLTALRRLQEDRSLLDSLRARAKRLERSVGAADRDRLDQYFTSVRDLEKRLGKATEWVDRPKPKVDAKAPEEIKAQHDLAKNERVMFDLVRMALETDSTRIVTVCLNTGTLTPRQIPGVKTMCHELTHHGNREDRLDELRLIEDAQFSALGEFLKGMDAAKEQGVSLLDQTAVLYGTNMGSANSHANDNLPVLLAGGGFKHAGHLSFDKKKNYPLSNLYVSLLQRLGVEASTFSSGTGTMRGIDLI
ncbi:DUF1552 domain-containing protein [Akkermansiaceae bacterium]|jgi:hypothetical protein|nr:DUF1552 domain-containing protein [Akkermansiaceae bacterium]